MVKGGRGHRRTQAERSAATRAALIEAGRALFAERGFAGASREDIVEAAGVTRGALYHHFADKADLFLHVLEAVEEDVGRRIATAAVASDDPLEQLRLGCAAYLDAALDRGVARICIVEAPAVLPAEVRQEVNERWGLGLVRDAVERAIAAGRMEPRPVDVVSRMLLAAVMAAATYAATAEDQPAARAEAGTGVEALIDGLARAR